MDYLVDPSSEVELSLVDYFWPYPARQREWVAQNAPQKFHEALASRRLRSVTGIIGWTALRTIEDLRTADYVTKKTGLLRILAAGIL
ncbi:hypothetical protein BV898_04935 [Hypsibius exemplaris]|uniref:Uncharacterized protein n=1 Tax=Hypsibius exemplaris TaxID=2072580 RepID=A0A1W0X142_HYPEX|nr:hypothetical protein BV898_04935 [Hypsibius exemplaris]